MYISMERQPRLEHPSKNLEWIPVLSKGLQSIVTNKIGECKVQATPSQCNVRPLDKNQIDQS